jgi:V/A-type H+-transporting ATPase subunit F
MEGKVAVLGSADFVMPFAALGLETFPVEEADEEILQGAKEIIDGKYALVVVAENIAPAAQEAFDETMKEPIPCVVVVPFTTEPTGFATETLNVALKMATGIDILQND